MASLRAPAEKLAQLEVKRDRWHARHAAPAGSARRLRQARHELRYVLNRDNVRARRGAEEDAALVRNRITHVGVRIAGATAGTEFTAELVRDVPAATRELPSGPRRARWRPTHRSRGQGRLKLIEPVVLIDLKLPAAALERVGARAWVLFDHGAEPLANQALPAHPATAAAPLQSGRLVKSSTLSSPGVVFGAYPERRVRARIGSHASTRAYTRFAPVPSRGRRAVRKFPGLSAPCSRRLRASMRTPPPSVRALRASSRTGVSTKRW
jgi:hypothetical protein